MAKSKVIFYCKECGNETSKWQGQCPACKAWNTLEEAPSERIVAGKSVKTSVKVGDVTPTRYKDITTEKEVRTGTGMAELDRVLGGGIVAGSLVLVGGDPGIGKSTLLLQMCRNLSKEGKKVLYASGEESLKQIKMRGDRIGEFSDSLFLLSETNMTAVEMAIEKLEPEVVIVDSIQTMYEENIDAAPGSVSQVREITAVLLRIAKKNSISIFIVGHVTKEGNVAGPRMLEHMVDNVLYFEGDPSASYRILRAVKNRFGSTNEIGVFEMREMGLVEVPNPSEYMMQGKPVGEPGSVVACAIEGTRSFVIEVQALACNTYFNVPRRTAAGTDYNRVNLLLAVVEKRLGMQLSSYDIYVNVAGGLRITEPAMDLGIVAAVVSSFKGKAIPDDMVIFGEVGLVGEVRAVTQCEKRVVEAAKSGFKQCIMPMTNLENIQKSGQLKNSDIKLVGIRNIRELLNHI
ncbi:DNA repair protein RadA [Eubacterium xylanophilum]|uniref:DNA repair protein RadA n=1 Tax=Eubacterium xylanophilum TaxID=39497 RepID=UPI00047DF8FD|nr:DNA repair protein RadA [Eubacterium xylanophilum]